MILIAMDRAPTVRSTDADGRLHVAVSNISKGNVCPYHGREIPGWQELGLDPDRVYNLLRDPEELARGAATFNNLPVLSEHVPVTAFDENSDRKDLVVGSTGTDAAMNGPYLTNSMVIWCKRHIDGIAKDEKRELSSAYRYRPDMTPGNFGGVDYDGVMRDIVGNHVALVIEGRAGPDVIVGDEQPMALKSKRALMLAGGLGGLIRPLLAQDAKFDMGKALSGVDAKSLAKPGATDQLADRVFGMVQPMLAADSALTVDQVKTIVSTVQGLALDEKDDLAEDEGDEDDKKAMDASDDDADKAMDESDDEDKKPAMDAATVRQMVKDAERRALAEAAAIRTAEREVAPIVGELVAMDSAAAVYKVGLKALDVDYAGLPDTALPAVFRAHAEARTNRAPALANDAKPSAAAAADFNKRYGKRVTLIRG